MGVGKAVFYDESRIAIIPWDTAIPAAVVAVDLPPRSECATLWLDQLLARLCRIELTLLVGAYARRHFRGRRRKQSLAATARAWEVYAPPDMPLPHPSPRNQAWLKHHPWFERQLVPGLRARINTSSEH